MCSFFINTYSHYLRKNKNYFPYSFFKFVIIIQKKNGNRRWQDRHTCRSNLLRQKLLLHAHDERNFFVAEKRGSASHVYVDPVGTRMAVLVVTGIGNKDTPRVEGHFVRRFTVEAASSTPMEVGAKRGLESQDPFFFFFLQVKHFSADDTDADRN